MKCLTIAFCGWLCCCSYFNSFSQEKNPAYKATYSSNFKIGNATYANMILDLWKDWDDNQFNRHDYFADTMQMWLPEGQVIRGKTEKFRGSMAKAKSIIHAWVPLYSTDLKHDLVCVWGQEEDTYPDGKVVTRDIHEVWWFNKDGKVSGMRQWAASFGQPDAGSKPNEK
jgi:hypothetical protein